MAKVTDFSTQKKERWFRGFVAAIIIGPVGVWGGWTLGIPALTAMGRTDAQKNPANDSRGEPAGGMRAPECQGGTTLPYTGLTPLSPQPHADVTFDERHFLPYAGTVHADGSVTLGIELEPNRCALAHRHIDLGDTTDVMRVYARNKANNQVVQLTYNVAFTHGTLDLEYKGAVPSRDPHVRHPDQQAAPAGTQVSAAATHELLAITPLASAPLFPTKGVTE